MYLSLGLVEDGFAVYDDKDGIVDCFSSTEYKEIREELKVNIENINIEKGVLDRSVIEYIKGKDITDYAIHISDPFKDYNLDGEKINIDTTFLESNNLVIILIESDTTSSKDCYIMSTSNKGVENVKILDGTKLFYGVRNKIITFSELIDTSEMKSMCEMFRRSWVSNLDLRMFDTSKVEDISRMFYFSRISNLRLGGLDFSNVKTAKEAFNHTKLRELSFGGTKEPTNLVSCKGMFGDNGLHLTKLNIQGYTFNENPFSMSIEDERYIISYVDRFTDIDVYYTDKRIKGYFDNYITALKYQFFESLYDEEDERFLDIVGDITYADSIDDIAETYQDELDELFYNTVIYNLKKVG